MPTTCLNITARISTASNSTMSGPAAAPAVMLLHGWPQTWYEWRHVIRLLGNEFTVVAPDLRGFGYSSKPASGYDATTIAADLAALSAHLGLKDITVVGHDWGAVFGYVYAASYPDHVSALGIVGDGLARRRRDGTSDVARATWEFSVAHGLSQSVPDLPELLIQGKERPYLQWFYEHFAYDPSWPSARPISMCMSLRSPRSERCEPALPSTRTISRPPSKSPPLQKSL